MTDQTKTTPCLDPIRYDEGKCGWPTCDCPDLKQRTALTTVDMTAARSRPDVFFEPATNFIGLRDGKCVAMAVKLKDAKENARTIAEWTRNGLDVLTVLHTECDPYWAQLREAFGPRRGALL